MAERLDASPHVRILNDVVLNQALVRFEAPGIDGDVVTRNVIARVQRDGTCWLGGTEWRGRAAMRVSVMPVPLSINAVRISATDAPGDFDLRTAQAPATCGAAIEVPAL